MICVNANKSIRKICKLITILSVNSLMLRTAAVMLSHYKCRGGFYPRSQVERYPVPDEKISWSVEYVNYKPNNYTSPGIYGKSWADPELDDSNFKPKWNSLDSNVNRVSYTGEYKIGGGYPLNPIGRTGIIGRGLLGRWGPNHAADPVVTRWKRDKNGTIISDVTKMPILQFVGIKRGDTGEWALPGGMVDPGEKVTTTAVREFQEEAVNSMVMSKEEKDVWENKFKEFFSNGLEIYKGYIDDPRNTDNAWMESVAFNFHDDGGSIVGSFKLNAGDDAVGVRWIDITPDLNLYASHKDIIKETYKIHSTKSDLNK